MRRPHRTSLALALLCTFACSRPPAGTVDVPGRDGAGIDGSGENRAVKTAAAQRGERRAYDGAPPVIPHQNFGMTCITCHNAEGMDVEGTGFAPPSPHEITSGLSNLSRCQQCHIFATSDNVFVANSFVGLQQDLRQGQRLNALAPPTLPHKAFMRENCLACHSGPAAREEIRTSHPERARCQQCHVPVTTRAVFQP